MDFGEVLSRAWNIIWKHKLLWLFGFLAGLSGGGGSGGGSGGSGMNFRTPGRDFEFRGMENMPQWMQRFFDTIPVWLPILLVLIGLVLLLIIIILGTIGRIGLTRGAWLADEGVDRLTFGQLWSYGMRYFWRVLLLIVIVIALSLTLLLIILIPTIGLTVVTFGIGLLCLLPLLCVLGIAISLLTVVFDPAVVAIVNEDLGIMDALQRAWNLFKTRLGEMIGMALILWVLSLVIGFVISLPLILIVAPAIASLFFESRMVFGGGMLLSLVLFLLYLPVLLVVQGILQAYTGSTWTLVFRRLTGRPAGQPSAMAM